MWNFDWIEEPTFYVEPASSENLGFLVEFGNYLIHFINIIKDDFAFSQTVLQFFNFANFKHIIIIDNLSNFIL